MRLINNDNCDDKPSSMGKELKKSGFVIPIRIMPFEEPRAIWAGLMGEAGAFVVLFF